MNALQAWVQARWPSDFGTLTEVFRGNVLVVRGKGGIKIDGGWGRESGVCVRERKMDGGKATFIVGKK